MVVQWPEHLPVVLEVGLITRSWHGKYFVSEHIFLNVFAGMTLNECADLQIWMSPVQGKSPPVQVEELCGNLRYVYLKAKTNGPVCR